MAAKTEYDETSQLEEIPIIKLDETLEFAKWQSLQSESGSYKGITPGRFWHIHAAMRNKTGIIKGGVYIYSPCRLRFVWNRSGGTLSQGALTKFFTQAVNNITAGAVDSFTLASQFVLNEQTGNLAIVVDNNDSAGAAPEGEMRIIVKNTTGICTVQPDFSVALAVNDDIVIKSKCNVIAAAIGDMRHEIAGIVVHPDGIPDNYGGWVLDDGITMALVKAGTAITEGTGLIADTGRLNEGSTSDNSLVIAAAYVAGKADIVTDLIPVEINTTGLATSS